MMDRLRLTTLGLGILGSLLVVAVAGCDEPVDLTLPTEEQVLSYYEYDGRLEAEVKGNVATLIVSQSPEQLRRGGTLWAKMGPYIFLFSEETRQLFEDFPGLAGVRVTTRVGRRTQVASALLAREALTDVLWRRSLNIAGHARREGSSRLTRLEDLIEWGEEHTEFEYNPRYTRRR